MNRIYRLIFSKKLGSYVVVAENTKSQGKGGSKSAVVGGVIAAGLVAAGLVGIGGEAAAVTCSLSPTVTTPNSGPCAVPSGGVLISGGNVINYALTGAGAGAISNSGLYIDGASVGGSIVIGTSTTVGRIIGGQGNINYGGDGVIIKGSGANLTGQIINNASSSISGHNGTSAAIRITSGATVHGITNAGVIDSSNGSGGGILLSSMGAPASTIIGNITNSGFVNVGSNGVEINGGSKVSGSISNSGMISAGTLGIVVLGSGSSVGGGISNSGTIYTGSAGVAVFTGTTVANGITNSGSINGGWSGVVASGSSIAGSIVNKAGGTILGALGGSSGTAGGVRLGHATLSGSIINSGLISNANPGANGIIVSGGNVVGKITNSGTIVGGAESYGAGLRLSSGALVQGGITNAGYIGGANVTGSQYGIELGSIYSGDTSTVTGGITNDATGTLVGSFGGLVLAQSTVTGGINNAGQIIASGPGSSGGSYALNIQANSTLSGGITNTGTISAVDGAILIASSTLKNGGVTNSGVMVGDIVIGNPYSLNPADSGSTIGGSIINSVTGTIAGNIYVSNSSIVGDIANKGSIDNRVMLSVSSLSGAINNSGVIGVNGNSAGIRLDGSTVAGGIVNSGTINGEILVGTHENYYYSVTGSIGSLVNGGISNSGQITNGIYISGFYNGDISASTTVNGGITNSGIVSGGDFGAITITSNSTVNGGITNSGSISTNGTYSKYYGDGILISGSSVSGDIINARTGSIAGNSMQGILVGGSVVSGAIINSGSISGADGIEVNQSSIANGITNSGLISGKAPASFDPYGGSSGGYGIKLSSNAYIGSSIVNQSGGTISGVSVGLGTSGWGAVVNGSITNATNAQIIGGSTGVNLSSASVYGDLQNSGTISGGTGAGISAWYTNIDGAINNAAGATISGANAGITINYSSVGGGITNAGLISGGSVGLGIAGSNVTGDIVNKLGATISGGIDIRSAGSIAGSIANSGVIDNLSGHGVALLGGSIIAGQISNSGGISGSNNGIYLEGSTLGGGIINSGTIAGGYNGIAVVSGYHSTGSGYGSYIASTINGSIINSGQIISGSTGIRLSYSSMSGGITNTGTIASGNYAGSSGDDSVALYGSSIGGSIINTGSMIQNGNENGIEVRSGSVIAGGVTNAGLIASTYVGGATTAGIQIQNSFVGGSVVNSGTITGFQTGIAAQGAGIVGGITNSGTIDALSSYGGVGIRIDSSSIDGSIVNKAGGTITGGLTGIRVASGSIISGGITNAGAIRSLSSSSSAGFGVEIKNSNILGGIVNSGAIIANGTHARGVDLSGSTVTGGIINTGSIFGQGTGINLQANSTLVGNITNSGTIIGSTHTGIWIGNNSTLVGSVVNSGYIYGGTNGGIALNSGSLITGSIVNSGFINSAGNGISVYSSSVISGKISNSGTISGAYNGIILGGSSIEGGISNSGLISGGSNGIKLSSSIINGGIANSGRIIGGAGGAGINIDPSVVNGGITNAGLISGDSGIAVYSSTVNGGITNLAGGTISGTGNGYGAIVVDGENSFVDVITNRQLISSVNGYGIVNQNSGTIGSIINTGLIISNGTDAIRNTGFINSVYNYGTITAPVGYAGINNVGGTINTLINAQGGTVAGTALTYKGALPTNYGIFITSLSNYGQLYAGAGTISGGTATGNTTFSVAADSTPTNGHLYKNVLSGVTIDQLTTTGTLTGSFTGTVSGSYQANDPWRLYEVGQTPVWNLCFGSGNCGQGGYVPSTEGNNNPAAFGAAVVLTGINDSPTPVPLSGVTNALNNMTPLAQSNAISQTLPVIVGAAPMAIAGSQRNFNQIVQARQSAQAGLSSGEEFIASKDVWMKGFGSWAKQGTVDNVSGYKVNTGGLAVGMDKAITPVDNIGVVFALASSNVTSSSSVAPSSVSINSYQLGVYGDHAFDPSLNLNYQADLGINGNKESRTLSAFAGVAGVTGNASANYNSTSEHLGAGLTKLLSISEDTKFLPSVRLDYISIQSQGYQESGAGLLNLNVSGQTYNELLASTNFRLDHDLTNKLKVTANAGVGYNMLNNQVQVTSAYQGGGAAFVTNGLSISPWLYNAGLGLTGQIDKNVSLQVRYDNQFSSTGYMNQMVGAKLKFNF